MCASTCLRCAPDSQVYDRLPFRQSLDRQEAQRRLWQGCWNSGGLAPIPILCWSNLPLEVCRACACRACRACRATCFFNDLAHLSRTNEFHDRFHDKEQDKEVMPDRKRPRPDEMRRRRRCDYFLEKNFQRSSHFAVTAQLAHCSCQLPGSSISILMSYTHICS